jgi:TnpA family transposase
MPRRRVLTDTDLQALFALPTCESDLALHWTLNPTDLSVIQRRRRDHNRLGFALQLCSLRYPGRLLRPGERIPAAALRHLADQLDVAPDTLAVYAARFQTRYEQLEDLRRSFGLVAMERPQRRELLEWLLPVALATTRAPAIATALLDELRRRQIIAPGPSVIERMVAAAVLLAERRVASQLTEG